MRVEELERNLLLSIKNKVINDPKTDQKQKDICIHDIDLYLQSNKPTQNKKKKKSGNLNFFPTHIIDPRQYDVLIHQSNLSNDKILINCPSGSGRFEIIKDIIIQNLFHERTTVILCDHIESNEKVMQYIEKAGYADYVLNFFKQDNSTAITQQFKKRLTQKTDFKKADKSVLNEFNIQKEILKKEYCFFNQQLIEHKNISQLINEYLWLSEEINYHTELNFPYQLDQENYKLINSILDDCKTIYPGNKLNLYTQIKDEFYAENIINKNFERLSPLLKNLHSELFKIQDGLDKIINKYIAIKKSDLDTQLSNINKSVESIEQLIDWSKAKINAKYNGLENKKSISGLFKNRLDQEKKNQFKIKLERLIQKSNSTFNLEIKFPKEITEAEKTLQQIKTKWNESIIEQKQSAQGYIYNFEIQTKHYYQLREEYEKLIENYRAIYIPLFKSKFKTFQNIDQFKTELNRISVLIDETDFTNTAIRNSIIWMNYFQNIPENIQNYLLKVFELYQPNVNKALRLTYLLQIIREHTLGKEINSCISIDNTKETIARIANICKVFIDKGQKQKLEQTHQQLTLNSSLNNKNNNEYLLGIDTFKEKELLLSAFPVILINSLKLKTLMAGKFEMFDSIIINEYLPGRFHSDFTHYFKAKQIIITSDYQRVANHEQSNNKQIDIFQDTPIFHNHYEFAQNYKFETFELKTHYASNHPDLFIFSNNKFYQNLVNLLPKTQSTGIEFYQVDGMFHSQINKREAEKIVEYIIKTEWNKSSCQIITSNTFQQQYIKDFVLEYANKNNSLKKKLEQLNVNGFSIDNIDQFSVHKYDIVIWSVCFGNDIKHQFKQDFGILSYAQGYKTLNKLITSARSKLILFNSIRANFYQKWKSQEIKSHQLFFSFIDYAQACSSQKYNYVQNILDNDYPSKEFIRVKKENNYIQKTIFEHLRSLNYSKEITINSYLGDFYIDILLPHDSIAILVDYDHNPLSNCMADIFKRNILEARGYSIFYTWSCLWLRNKSFALEQIGRILSDSIKS